MVKFTLLLFFFIEKPRLNNISFHKNHAFCEKYLAKSWVKAKLFVRKGYRKGKQNSSVYEKQFLLWFNVRILVSLDLTWEFWCPLRNVTTLFVKSTLQKVESRRNFLYGRATVRENKLFLFSQKPRFLWKVLYETESRRVRSKHGGDIVRGNTNHSVYEKGCPCEQPFD